MPSDVTSMSSDKPPTPAQSEARQEIFDERVKGGAPWEFKALCVSCQQEHHPFTWNEKRRDSEGPLIRFGTCTPCIDKDEAEHQARLDAQRAANEPKEKKIDSLEVARRKLATRQEDAFDPWETDK